MILACMDIEFSDKNFASLIKHADELAVSLKPLCSIACCVDFSQCFSKLAFQRLWPAISRQNVPQVARKILGTCYKHKNMTPSQESIFLLEGGEIPIYVPDAGSHQMITIVSVVAIIGPHEDHFIKELTDRRGVTNKVEIFGRRLEMSRQSQ